MIRTISKNKVSDVLVRLNVVNIFEFGFAFSWMLKYYLYLLGAIITAAILELEKIRMI